MIALKRAKTGKGIKSTKLNDVLFLTGIQILQTGYFHESPNMAKKKINKLARAGYLLKHKIREAMQKSRFIL